METNDIIPIITMKQEQDDLTYILKREVIDTFNEELEKYRLDTSNKEDGCIYKYILATWLADKEIKKIIDNIESQLKHT